jgi:putative ABC transport system ATP-binding protein
MSILRLRALRVTTPTRVLVDGLSFELAAGARLALRGPSGSGKTTLLRSIAGLVDPAAGEVSFGGASPEELGWPRWRRQVLYLSQQPQLGPGRVTEELAKPFSYRVDDQRYDPKAAGALLARLGLEAAALEQPCRELSGGERQRVALARALLLSPKVLLLDEPTSALDPDNAARTEALILERCAAGMSLILVTHDAALSERLCTEAIALGGAVGERDP